MLCEFWVFLFGLKFIFKLSEALHMLPRSGFILWNLELHCCFVLAWNCKWSFKLMECIIEVVMDLWLDLYIFCRVYVWMNVVYFGMCMYLTIECKYLCRNLTWFEWYMMKWICMWILMVEHDLMVMWEWIEIEWNFAWMVMWCPMYWHLMSE